ncbi:mitochondrial DNA polymerase A [Cavenderia fasciculata]|uniref:Mitochondrial DNA polymerase A n=1 Tax=Cavenderia fasciculata TaxID=261658 RepID=F4Q2H1_CACFS|nr:mitochondrial DNA polymerase A [Cavenderia fasciculata]EGG16650.1 mitochondrial DNA polymerase A [Cavenderia fasciculata]|eukprot:XP_004355124.1 mitochondrial DNA polymerase A [Cavenderia fasciculata]
MKLNIKSLGLVLILIINQSYGQTVSFDATYQLSLVNAIRAQAGKAALSLSPCLVQSAQFQSNYQANSNQMTHDNPAGDALVRMSSFTANSLTSAGENVAAGYYNDDDVVAAWRQSPGHYANMIGDFLYFGCGMAASSTNQVVYWTQNFAIYSSCSSQTTGGSTSTTSSTSATGTSSTTTSPTSATSSTTTGATSDPITSTSATTTDSISTTGPGVTSTTTGSVTSATGTSSTTTSPTSATSSTTGATSDPITSTSATTGSLSTDQSTTTTTTIAADTTTQGSTTTGTGTTSDPISTTSGTSTSSSSSSSEDPIISTTGSTTGSSSADQPTTSSDSTTTPDDSTTTSDEDSSSATKMGSSAEKSGSNTDTDSSTSIESSGSTDDNVDSNSASVDSSSIDSSSSSSSTTNNDSNSDSSTLGSSNNDDQNADSQQRGTSSAETAGSLDNNNMGEDGGNSSMGAQLYKPYMIIATLMIVSVGVRFIVIVQPTSLSITNQHHRLYCTNNNNDNNSSSNKTTPRKYTIKGNLISSSSLSNSIPPSVDNSEPTATTTTKKKKVVNIRIKSKDPFIDIGGNNKVYLRKPKNTTTPVLDTTQLNIDNNNNTDNLQQVNSSSIITDLLEIENNNPRNLKSIEEDISLSTSPQPLSSSPSSFISASESSNSIEPIKEEQQVIGQQQQEEEEMKNSILRLKEINISQDFKATPTQVAEAQQKKKAAIAKSKRKKDEDKDDFIDDSEELMEQLDDDITTSTLTTSSTTTTTNNNKNEEKQKLNLDQNNNHVVIIDGTPLAYKAYNTISGLTHNGEPIGALFGFTKALLKILKELKPDYVLVCFDPTDGAGNFRHDIYEKYKANRPSTPLDLKQQLPLLPQVCTALGIEYAKQSRFESDDLIATYANIVEQANKKLAAGNDNLVVDGQQQQQQKYRATIVSDDKDMLQLVSDDVHIYNTRTNSIFCHQDVIDKMGVPSHLITSFQALAGDSVDNIPGVPSLGPKSASAIINSLGHIDNVLANIEQIPLKFREKVRNNSEQIKISYQLATLSKQAETKVPLEGLKWNPVNKLQFVEFLDKYNFNNIKGKLDNLGLVYEGEENKEISQSSSSSSSSSSAYTIDPDYVLTDEEVKDYLPNDVTCVNTVEHAREIDVYHACDTEVIDIDVKEQSPIGHGKIICFSIYCGPDIDFGTGSRIWVDILGSNGDEILQIFKEYFEDESIFKVWHNYAFDRHVFYNHNIDVVGFGGDTMLMARLWDASRMMRGGYSLEGLTKDLLDKHKTNMDDLFGQPKLKSDGTPGKGIILPPLEHLQRSSKHLTKWIEYSSRDAEVTWMLRENLHKKLMTMEWIGPNSNMWDFYYMMWRPFGQLLTDMERRGMKVDLEHLKGVEVIAQRDITEHNENFRRWALGYCENVKHMNIDSDAQVQQFLFAPCRNVKTKEEMAREEEFERENVDGIIEEGAKKAKKKIGFKLAGLGLPVPGVTNSGWPSVDAASLRLLSGKDPANGKYGTAYNHFAVDRLPPNATEEEIEKAKEEGRQACLAIASLLEVGSIGTLISSFIIPLQRLADSNHRLHTSVNVNTETGRLSSRRPNLQNQPALEKDRYKIRKAFTCEPGNTLVVADYGQLELRLLGHITNCKSMLDAFRVGGDFHSRTAMGMYPHVRAAVDAGEVLLEWDGEGAPPKPLLKDKFASERRKAKTLNFSIAYGKTAHGLSKDWNVTLSEAQNTLNRWYEDRPEVLLWQRSTIQIAHQKKWTRTLMGRYRLLPDIDSKARGFVGHSERASINTPLQGGAADIVMKAMLIIEQDARLKELGYRLIMQIHDELILEGPEEHAPEARDIVIKLMGNPLNKPLLVDLVVDCRFAKTWYEAK